MLKVEISESDLKELILKHLQSKLGTVEIELRDITIEVKSKQNYHSEWERAAFRASVTSKL